MLLPTQLMPSLLGISWNASPEQCLENLKGRVLYTSPISVTILLPLGDNLYPIDLWFDKDQLDRIQADLHVSQALGDSDLDQSELLEREFESLFDHLLNQYILSLGNPDFEGNREAERFPKGETAWKLAYWNYDEGRAQLELSQQDREDPYVIRISTYQPLL